MQTCATCYVQSVIYNTLQSQLTNLRPDAVLYSQHLKAVIMLELTVPIEDRVSVSETIKTTRYKTLVNATLMVGKPT